MYLYDLSALSNAHKTGIPNYILQLGRALNSRGEELAGFFDNGKILAPPEAEAFIRNRLAAPVNTAAVNVSLSRRVLRKIKRETALALRPLAETVHHARGTTFIRERGVRLQHFTGHVIRHAYELPTLSTICDMTPYSHTDLHAAHNVRQFRESIEWLKGRMDRGLPVLLPVISEFTKREVGRFLGADFESRCRVTLLGFDRALFRPDVSVPRGNFILSVGTLEPRKNLTLLLRAFESFGRKHPGLELRLAGAKGWKNESLDEAIARHPLKDRIRVLGFVSDLELARLYRECALFCYPSLLEGFGLPPLEAMASGAPVVLSNASSLPEVGGDAAIYCEPTDALSLERALERAFDERVERSRLSLAQAQKFSWESCADLTLRIYDEVAGAKT